VSVLAGREVSLTDGEARALLAIPADRWVRSADAGRRAIVRRLVENGLLVTDEPDEALAELRSRDERLASPPWNRYAALFHAMTQWRGVVVELAEPPSPSSKPRPARWWPPHHFHASPGPIAVQGLPPAALDRPLYDLLRARKTTRGYDDGATLAAGELATILGAVWGCHGVLDLGAGVALLKKTSPSGGGQHPVEVYPLVRAVEDVEPGLYHYSVERHELELLERIPAGDVATLIVGFTAGQPHYAKAQVLFLMAARFARNHWKYPAHEKAFRTLLMDAAHLSQTFYLVCTQLGLGAFVTGAINDADIDRRLGLEAFGESTLLACGCGRPVPSEREPRFQPYEATAAAAVQSGDGLGARPEQGGAEFLPDIP
jgi:putative peptide maturation dehydrogenase